MIGRRGFGLSVHVGCFFFVLVFFYAVGVRLVRAALALGARQCVGDRHAGRTGKLRAHTHTSIGGKEGLKRTIAREGYLD